MDPVRRMFLKTTVATGSLFLPLPYALALEQTESGSKLLQLPKVALVIGNAAYREVPVLSNPTNDATAIAATLKQDGFEVTAKLNASRADMLAAIEAHVRTLAARRCVGLFYFAGHGLQLAWRNYLVPVDASIHKLDDVQRQCVELGRLVEGLTSAANPMNVIILDACRQNPFAADFRETQKGLSQMDAPPTTLLAYSTAPGNVASDGDGANGLYTEHLLKEIQVREAKIEDVFKRVRLAVRRKSNGAQIPWESTSLEEDFYFLPPTQWREPSETEREAEFEAQLAQWEKIKNSDNAGALTEFLGKYPSGHFSELAQHQLDRVLAAQGEKKARIAAAEGNPYTKGSAILDTHYKVGDSYSYRLLDPETRLVRRSYTTTITEINQSQVIYDKGMVTDLQGNTLRMADGRRFTDNQNVPVEFEVGKQWTTRYRATTPQGQVIAVEMNYVIVSRAPLTVPAGTFNAFLIEGNGVSWVQRGKMELHIKFWWDPQRVRRPIAREEFRQIRLGESESYERRRRRGGGGQERVKILSAERHELTAFSQS